MIQKEIRNNEIMEELTPTYEELTRVISSYSEEQFNTIPFEGSWTAGQVTEHLLKSDISSLINGRTRKTERDPAENIDKIKESLLNFNIKMKNPDFNTPTQHSHDKKKMLSSLKNAGERVKKAVDTLDLSETCVDFEMPGTGYITRLEWICFSIYHTQRHTHQLKKIFKKLKSKKF